MHDAVAVVRDAPRLTAAASALVELALQVGDHVVEIHADVAGEKRNICMCNTGSGSDRNNLS